MENTMHVVPVFLHPDIRFYLVQCGGMVIALRVFVSVRLGLRRA